MLAILAIAAMALALARLGFMAFVLAAFSAVTTHSAHLGGLGLGFWCGRLAERVGTNLVAARLNWRGLSVVTLAVGFGAWLRHVSSVGVAITVGVLAADLSRQCMARRAAFSNPSRRAANAARAGTIAS